MKRKTEQREAIRGVFRQIERPLTADEVLQHAQKQVSSLGIATVYRNLKSFVEENILRTVELPGEPTRYELTDLGHHHHFQCENCNRVFDIPGCPDMSNFLPDDYQVRHHKILMYGSCPNCKAK